MSGLHVQGMCPERAHLCAHTPPAPPPSVPHSLRVPPLPMTPEQLEVVASVLFPGR